MSDRVVEEIEQEGIQGHQDDQNQQEQFLAYQGQQEHNQVIQTKKEDIQGHQDDENQQEQFLAHQGQQEHNQVCLLYTSPSPRDS